MAKAAAPYLHPKLASMQHSGPRGGPIQTVDLTKLSGDDLARLDDIFGPLAGPGDDDVLVSAEKARREQEAERQRIAHDAERIRARCQTLAGFVREGRHCWSRPPRPTGPAPIADAGSDRSIIQAKTRPGLRSGSVA
ncbi:MAG: hypothetical protein E5X53_33875 [Mesorhizobium sp.]|nr:MAG: hypothetical protein EOR73_32445 [Mesorhizobium sp.]TIP71599.1 MAG: hypothetical protein E5X55_22235 [Mesorhizobium sp.]TIQ06246.1 MAG: hypothetical protein E5X57_26300 [Mesorhizobium sp.]TIR47457.1 MAG: hypothetical protein E5X53_33875 [Mesorhizobium sp.]TJV92674.1 MAG: hypothetical protein E5X52_33090 [Mesorhizobium sp.]